MKTHIRGLSGHDPDTPRALKITSGVNARVPIVMRQQAIANGEKSTSAISIHRNADAHTAPSVTSLQMSRSVGCLIVCNAMTPRD